LVNVAEKVVDLKKYNIVEIESEGRIEVECYDWNYDEECGRYQREVELLKYLSKELVEIRVDTSFLTHNMFVGINERKNEYDTVVK
jgi:hypothetical protein